MKNLAVIFISIMLSSCVCDLDELSSIENLEARVTAENALFKTQRVEAGKLDTRFRDKFKEVYCTDNEIMETHLYGRGLLFSPEQESDRLDWLKLGGYYFKTFQPHGETIMIAFRTRPELNATEYTFYYHNISNKDKYKAVGSVPGYVDDSNTLLVSWDDNENASTYTKFTIEILNDTDIALILEDKEGAAITDVVSFPEVRRNFTRGNVHYGKGREPLYDVTAVKAIY